MNIEKRLDELNRAEFYLNMKDRWSDADFKKMDEIKAEQRKLKKLLDQDD